MIYFTSDLHFGHQQEFLYKPRGFSSVEEHDIQILENINSTVMPDDTLYVLGDLMLYDNENGMKFLSQIKCQDVKVIFGNHDSPKRIDQYASLPNFHLIGFSDRLIYRKWIFMLSHYPMATTNIDDVQKPVWARTYNLCGHTHTKELFDPLTNSYHCELDAHDNFPVSIEQIREDIRNRFLEARNERQ